MTQDMQIYRNQSSYPGLQWPQPGAGMPPPYAAITGRPPSLYCGCTPGGFPGLETRSPIEQLVQGVAAVIQNALQSVSALIERFVTSFSGLSSFGGQGGIDPGFYLGGINRSYSTELTPSPSIQMGEQRANEPTEAKSEKSGFWNSLLETGGELLLEYLKGKSGSWGKVLKKGGKYIGKGWDTAVEYGKKAYDWVASSKLGSWIGSWF